MSTLLPSLVDITLLIDLALRSSVIVIVGLLVSAVLRRRSAALRHSVLVAAIVGAAAVVPLSLVVPAWNVSILERVLSIGPSRNVRSIDVSRATRGAEATTSEDASVEAAATTSVSAADPRRADAAASSAGVETRPFGPVTLATRLAIVWGVGVAIGAVFLFVGLMRIVRVVARAEPVRGGRWARVADRLSRANGLRRPVTLLQTNEPDLLATWGAWRPRVLLPVHARGWSEDRIHVVLCHELAHIRRFDWVVQLCAETLRTIYWFNPLLWVACAWLRRESEQACDDAVLRAGVSGQDYASHLLEVARSCRRAGPAWASAVPMARPSTLERRVTAMLNPGLVRGALSRRGLVLTAMLFLGVTLPMAALRGAQASPQPLTGAVYDESGGVLPGVELTLGNAENTVNEKATTDGAGRFVFSSVAPGRYVLAFKLMGFRELRQEFDLALAKDWDRAVTLGVGHVKETIIVRASALPNTAARTPTRPQPVRVGGNIRAPRKLVDVRPIYPDSMRAEGREGTVPSEAIIDRDGNVSMVRIAGSQVHPDFAIAAADAVRQWKFEPTLLNGEPVEVVMNVSVSFTLEQ